MITAVLFTLLIHLANGAEKPAVALEGNTLTLTGARLSKTYFGNSEFQYTPSFKVEIPLSDLEPKHAGTGIAEAESLAPVSVSAVAKTGAVAAAMPASPPPEPKPPREIDSLIAQANSLYYARHFEDSLRLVDEALRLEPKHPRALLMKGSLMHAMGQRELARKYWQAALELDPENVDLKGRLEILN